MEPDIAALVPTNEAPSEDMILRVRGLLAKPLQDMDQADKEIQQLENSLSAIRDKRSKTQQLVHSYQAVLSPARRLPHDILREIFLHCLPTNRNPIMSASEAPTVLTRVCSSWRAVALSSPRIWARLHIPFPGNAFDTSSPFGSDRKLAIENPKYVETMKRRCKVVEEWLSRSGDCPLSISLNYPTFHSVLDEQLDTPTEELFDVILPHVERWEELELSMPFDIYDKFQTKFSVNRANRLEKLRTTFYDRERTGISASRPVPLLAVPKLRHLAFNAMPITWNIQSLPIAPIWENLNTLGLHSSVGDADVLDILKLTPNLIHCRLSVLSKWESNDLAIFDPSTKGIAHLPRLETLSINDSGSLVVMAPTCKAIDAPVLQWLDYYRPAFYAPPVLEQGEDVLQCPFLPLLVNSAATLKKLSWEPTGVKDLMACLRAPEKLRHLVMGQEPLYMRRNQGLGRHPYPRPPSFSMTSFDLAPFIVPIPETTEDPDASSPIVLPCLQVLEAYQVTNVSDDCLLQFICSRLRRFSRGRERTPTTITDISSPTTTHAPTTSRSDPDDPLPVLNNGIAALRKVIFEFDRPKQIEIQDQVEKVAVETGLPFYLELFYAPDPPANHNPHSTSFGLNDDGRSWTYWNLNGAPTPSHMF